MVEASLKSRKLTVALFKRCFSSACLQIYSIIEGPIYRKCYSLRIAMIIGKPSAEPVNREREISELVSGLSSPRKNVNFALIGHRRIGKTTILWKVRHELNLLGLNVVYLDLSLYKVTPVEFAQMVMSQTTHNYAKDLGRVDKATMIISSLLRTLSKLRKLRFTLEPSVDQSGQFSIALRPELVETEDLSKVFALAFDYANEVSRKAKKRIVIMIDEFPAIVEFARYPKLKNILERFRNVLENRENVCYVVSGSRVHFMREVLGSGDSPLFGHFAIREIKELAESDAIQLYMRASNASASEARSAYMILGGHPFYLIMLAENRKPDETIEQTYRRILTSQTGALYLYANYVLKEDLGSSTKETRLLKILRAIALGRNTVSSISEFTRIKITSLPFYIGELERYDLVRKSDQAYSITDSVIRDYLTLIVA